MSYPYLKKKNTSKGVFSAKKSNSLFTWQKLKSFLPYLIAIIVGLWVFPKIYKLILTAVTKVKTDTLESTQATDNAINLIENSDAQTQQQKADSITTSKSVQSSTIQLVNALGTKFSDNGNWWDFLNPKGWTENDKEVADILIFQHKNYLLMQRLYNRCYTNSRNLREDLVKYLDSDEQLRVKKTRPTFNF